MENLVKLTSHLLVSRNQSETFPLAIIETRERRIASRKRGTYEKFILISDSWLIVHISDDGVGTCRLPISELCLKAPQYDQKR